MKLVNFDGLLSILGYMYSSFDYNNIIYNPAFEEKSIVSLGIGDVYLPSGQIVVCDPVACPRNVPLAREVSPGSYPVTLYTTESWGQRVAIMVITFSKARATRFELAVLPGEDPDMLTGFPVDAGLGGCMDAETALRYQQLCDDYFNRDPEGNVYIEYFDKPLLQNSQHPVYNGWINWSLPGGSGHNIVMCYSGLGDGCYPAYWGCTEEKEVVNLVIDYQILP